MKKVTTILALLLAQNSYALQLEGMNGVEILAINGTKVESSLFSNQAAPEVDAGYHQVVLRYSKEFDEENRTAESSPVIFNIDLQQDTVISVANYNTLNKAENAIDKGLVWQAKSAGNQYVITDAVTLKDSGFLPFRDIEAVIAAYNKKNNITIATPIKNAETIVGTTTPQPSVVGITATTAAVTAASATKASDLKTDQCTGLDQIALYQQSTPAQKKAFRLWLLEQDLK